METDQHDLDTKLKKAKKWLLERYFRVEVTMSYRSEGEKKVEKEAALERFKSTIGTLTDMGTSLGRQPEAGTIAHLVNLPTKSSFKVMIHPPPAPPPPPPPARPPSKPTEESNESKTME